MSKARQRKAGAKHRAADQRRGRSRPLGVTREEFARRWDDTFGVKQRALADANRKQPRPELWYLSFAGEEGFFGACVVEAPGVLCAVQKAHRLGINPGGEVVAFGADNDERLAALAKYPRDVLLTREWLYQHNGDMVTVTSSGVVREQDQKA